MQQRFCSCGHLVLVRYLSSKGVWRPLFIASRTAAHWKIVDSCPRCQAPLNIHSLR